MLFQVDIANLPEYKYDRFYSFVKMKIAVGFSGGVDSLVTSILLREKGYEIHAVTFVFSRAQLESCFQKHVKSAAKKLNIPHDFVDLRMNFERVLNYFKNGYLSGETPNPCVFCNEHVKWPGLFEFAGQIGAEKVATGHYAKIEQLQHRFVIRKGDDPEKDQSFFLWNLTPEMLEKVELPLGGVEKSNVKEIAQQFGYDDFAIQKESTGPCFVGQNYRDTLKDMMTPAENPGKGNFLDADGEMLGRHNGYPFYTISQRKGLGLEGHGKKFVRSINPCKNQVLLGNAGDLWSSNFYLRDWHLHFPELATKEKVEVKIRYRSQKAKGKIHFEGELIHIALLEPEWAIAPGQTAALYFDDRLIGGGYIDAIL